MVNSVVKTFNILEYIASHESGKRLVAISKEFTINPPTAHNLLKTLLELGYVQKKDNLYSISDRFFDAFVTPFKFGYLWKIAEPLLRALSDTIKETVVLAVYHEGKRRIVGGHVSHQHSVIAPIDPEAETIMYSKPTGRVLLAHLDQTELRAYVEKNRFPGPAWDNITTFEALDAGCQIVRRNGYSMNDPEKNEIAAFAVPILRKDCTLVAALGTYLPATRYQSDIKQLLLDALRGTASTISLKLNGHI
ncbi:MAG: hypothetical protein A2268_03850 [Candidatus Raymondbacteria bacterium RifOxyA12_full_50_37]|nr:MAG: hypothetical protein A2268_03850 [Candidatus Raymondbacteria bacterium RifOxyA12_full_50_37]OGJ92642.1 MAG: hypothetical protein A2248_06100 [Candidatus Raymondbacteria bacterium RIFOXYA2_FULL_49_16]OGJ97996.1 MAG: hypothetical protein A2453_03125 [Candidatus Raymondbacteria bacterium RIFOXYC2_FULL_50_21]OGP44881.1 MAG: hypothetical protein A2324_21860 [Candidatus Raymondbacteria bacterium RIFOXYB2_FULL_49_35]